MVVEVWIGIVVLTIGTETDEREMDRRWFEMDSTSCFAHEFKTLEQVKVDEFATAFADRVVMSGDHAVITAGTISEGNFPDETGFAEIVERIVDSGIADGVEPGAGADENLIGRGVPITFTNRLEHHAPLRRQPCLNLNPRLSALLSHES